MAFGEILREIRMKNGDSLRKLAEKTDIVFTYIDRLEKGTVPINKNLLEKFINAYPLYKKEFEKAYLDEVMPDSLKNIKGNSKKISNVIVLPVYGKASAGNGKINFDYPIFEIPTLYDHSFSEDSYYFEVEGNSMEPTLKDGEFALVDPQKTDYEKNKIYVVLFNDETFIKRVVKDDKNRLTILKSDNPEYDDVYITGEMEDYFKILGKVIKISSFRNTK